MLDEVKLECSSKPGKRPSKVRDTHPIGGLVGPESWGQLMTGDCTVGGAQESDEFGVMLDNSQRGRRPSRNSAQPRRAPINRQP